MQIINIFRRVSGQCYFCTGKALNRVVLRDTYAKIELSVCPVCACMEAAEMEALINDRKNRKVVELCKW